MKTVLFGLDGATYTVLDELVRQGVMPCLAEVYRRGGRGILESTATPLTPQAWTSLATSRTAGHHGIGDFIRCDRRDGGAYLHINNSRDIRTETLWQYVSRQGKRVTVLNYYGLAPAQPLCGHSMPGFTTGRHLRRCSYPADLFERLRQVPAFDVSLLGMDLEIERRGLHELAPDEWLEWIGHHVERDAVWAGVLEHLMTAEPSDLTAVVFDGVDKIQHLAYRYLDPAYCPARPTAWERQVIERCGDYFRQVDACLGRVLERVGPWGRVFIVSDHGFTASQEIVYINTYLERQGWLKWRSDAQDDAVGKYHTDRPADDANAIDLARSRAYALSPSGNGVFLDAPPAEYGEFREQVIAGLLALRGPDGGQVVVDVKRREDYFPGPCMKDLPDLTLTLRDFGFISVLKSPEVVTPRQKPLGTHHPDGVVLGIGPGVRSGADWGRLSILDVAPLLLHSLGLEIPADYEGRFAPQAYEAAYLDSDPPRLAAACNLAELAAGISTAGGGNHQNGAELDGDDLDQEDEAVLLDRLRSLGYIE